MFCYELARAALNQKPNELGLSFYYCYCFRQWALVIFSDFLFAVFSCIHEMCAWNIYNDAQPAKPAANWTGKRRQ